jgi:molybdopterin/thiamine biosynthesis adenylyltransferase
MNERWDRLQGIVDVGELRERHVLVVGLGSGGSTVALELAKAGVGRFTLVDHDRLEVSNLIRHECDDRYLGWQKAAAVADLVLFRNPDAEVEVVAADAFALGGRLVDAIAGTDLVAVCTDVEPPKNLLNRLCLEAGVPAVYAGVYARGVGGEVVRCGEQLDDPCYACVTSVLKESAPVPATEEELEYGVPADQRSVPALGLDIRLVALVHAKLCLLSLLGEEDAVPGNVVLFGTAAVEGLFPRPFASAVVDVAPQAGCLVCAPVRSGSGAFDLGAPAA